MARIDISARVIGDKELSAALARMSSHDIPKAISAGVRLAARGGRTTLAKEVGQRYSLTASRIKQDVGKPVIASGGQSATITTNRKPITAMQFKPRQTRQGLSMSIFRGERTVVKSGFIAKGLPFRRQGKARLPIDTIKGPSIHAIYTGGKHAHPIQKATKARIEEQLVKGIEQRISAMGRGFAKG